MKTSRNSYSFFKSHLVLIAGFLCLGSAAQFAHCAEVEPAKKTPNPPAKKANTPDPPTLMTDSDEIPQSLLELTHPQLPSGSLSESSLNTQFSNLVTTEEDKFPPLGSPLPDDSYMLSSAPMAFLKEVTLCSDRDFIAALKPPLGSSPATAFNTIQHDDCITIDNGCIMFAPSKDTRVVTPRGTVVIEKNSLAIVVSDSSHLSVYDIHDDHKGSIRLEMQGHTIALAPGRHVTVTHGKVSEFSDINPIQTILHKGVSSHKVGDASKAFVSNFSVLSAINALPPLGALMQSQHSEARKVASQILKTSSILMQLDNGGSAYTFHTKQRSVALNGTVR